MKRNINNQIYNNLCYKTICLNMTKLKHGVQWGCLQWKRQFYSEKQWIMTLTFHSLWCIILEITVHNMMTEANYTALPELTHRYSWGLLKIQTMWNLHFLCKNWKPLCEQKNQRFTFGTSVHTYGWYTDPWRRAYKSMDPRASQCCDLRPSTLSLSVV